MKFVFCGFSFFAPLLNRLCEEHELEAVFTTNDEYKSLRRHLTNSLTPVRTDQISGPIIAEFVTAGCELIFVAGYPYYIPQVSGIRAVNLHPTMLPDGKGADPIPYLLLHARDKAGYTIHKITDVMDSGDIISQRSISLGVRDTTESYLWKVATAAIPVCVDLFNRLDDVWSSALPQSGGASWCELESCNVLDSGLSQSADICALVRALGSRSWISIDGRRWHLRDAEGWSSTDDLQSGNLIFRGNGYFVIKVSDGYVRLTYY